MKNRSKLSIYACTALLVAFAPAANAQFGLGDLVDSAKKEMNKATKPQDARQSVSPLSEAGENYQRKYKNYEKTVLQGAGIGALVGGAAGYALGGSEEAVAIGAGVGAIAGGAVGKQIAEESDGIVKSRKKLDKQLKKSKKYREKTLEMLDVTQQTIVELENEIQILQNAYLTGEIAASELTERLTVVEGLGSDLKNGLAKDVQRIEIKETIMKEAAVKAAASPEADIQERVPAVQSEQYAIGGVKTVALEKKRKMEVVESKIVSLRRMAG